MKRIRAGSAVLAAGWLAPAAALAQERPGDWGMHPRWWIGGAWGIAMMLMMLVFWGLVIAGIAVGIRWLVRSTGDSWPDAALEILRQRYARGEISKEEFEARRRDLT